MNKNKKLRWFNNQDNEARANGSEQVDQNKKKKKERGLGSGEQLQVKNGKQWSRKKNITLKLEEPAILT